MLLLLLGNDLRALLDLTGGLHPGVRWYFVRKPPSAPAPLRMRAMRARSRLHAISAGAFRASTAAAIPRHRAVRCGDGSGQIHAPVGAHSPLLQVAIAMGAMGASAAADIADARRVVRHRDTGDLHDLPHPLACEPIRLPDRGQRLAGRRAAQHGGVPSLELLARGYGASFHSET